MKDYAKKEIPSALLAGAICGIVALIGILFVAPERWYLSFVVAAFMSAVVWYKASSDKKKNSGKYERDEHLVDFPYIFSAEGYLREESDRDAKFYFGENEIGALHYRNVRPIFDTFEKEKIKAGYFDRCGWFTIVFEGTKTRIVIPKGKAEEASSVLEEILKND
ncbi:MAG: hypothetical protein IJO22_00410 [Oscillospiraceae bacterium]|nr:hypothetical protein [Oscillospiraceae bacterium]